MAGGAAAAGTADIGPAPIPTEAKAANVAKERKGAHPANPRVAGLDR
jgi:hypothetical protein